MPIGVPVLHRKASTEEWGTPQRLFDKLNEEFGFNLDVCATAVNRKCKNYFNKKHNALRQRWFGVCWMNPPYSIDALRSFMRKASQETVRGVTTVCLVPVKTEQDWWHDYVWNKPNVEIRFLRGRLRFEHPDRNRRRDSAYCPICIVVFREPATRQKSEPAHRTRRIASGATSTRAPGSGTRRDRAASRSAAGPGRRVSISIRSSRACPFSQ
jgi:phage N-6-adenine-methyltransferase